MKSNCLKEILGVLALFAITSVFITACSPPSESSAEVEDRKPETIMIEAESMILTSAEIINDEGVSGGKAINMLSADAIATKELTLPEGQYVMNVMLMAKDELSDGFYLVVGDKVRRTSNYNFNKWVYGFKFIVFESDGKNPVTIHVASAWEGKGNEFGMLIDHLEIVELCNSANVLENWMR